MIDRYLTYERYRADLESRCKDALSIRCNVCWELLAFVFAGNCLLRLLLSTTYKPFALKIPHTEIRCFVFQVKQLYRHFLHT
jgi:hypothetical protein